MSSDFVESIHIRLRDELKRLNLSMAEAARQIEEDDSQGLRDVCIGRKRATAGLIAKLSMIEGLDVYYVLTGQRVGSVTTLSARESALVENYRAAPEDATQVREKTGAYLAQSPGALKRSG